MKETKSEMNHAKKVQQTERYYEADDVAKIAAELIPQFHQHLQNVPIIYFFDAGKMKEHATMSKRSDKEIFISGYKFAMQVSKAKWMDLNVTQRIALVDHELCHAFVNADGDLQIIDHDIEEFSVIVKRHGIWNKMLEHFAPVVSEQLDLFITSKRAA